MTVSKRNWATVLVMALALSACESSTEYNNVVVTPDYDPALVRKAVRNGALVTEVIGSPSQLTGERAIADAMEMPPHFRGVLLAGEPPTGPGNPTTRLVLSFDSSKRTTPDRMCAAATAIRPRPGKDLNLTAALCVGEKPVAYGHVSGASYSSLTLKEFRAISANFLGQVMPASRS